MNFKTLFAALIVVVLNFNIAIAGNVIAGGNVPVINTVTNIGAVSLNLAQDGVNEIIADMTINNNTRSFELYITFKNGGKFINAENNSAIQPSSIKITESGQGKLGDGITPLINKEMDLNNNQFVWQPENQTTATRNYKLNILATWKSDGVISGLYTEIITTHIAAKL
jgi:hypothetical protein